MNRLNSITGNYDTKARLKFEIDSFSNQFIQLSSGHLDNWTRNWLSDDCSSIWNILDHCYRVVHPAKVTTPFTFGIPKISKVMTVLYIVQHTFAVSSQFLHDEPRPRWVGLRLPPICKPPHISSPIPSLQNLGLSAYFSLNWTKML